MRLFEWDLSGKISDRVRGLRRQLEWSLGEAKIVNLQDYRELSRIIVQFVKSNCEIVFKHQQIMSIQESSLTDERNAGSREVSTIESCRHRCSPSRWGGEDKVAKLLNYHFTIINTFTQLSQNLPKIQKLNHKLSSGRSILKAMFYDPVLSQIAGATQRTVSSTTRGLWFIIFRTPKSAFIPFSNYSSSQLLQPWIHTR